MKNLFIFLTMMIESSIAFGQQNLKTVKDIDGNVYKTVTIGSQTWMVENLKTTHYNDGKAIPNVTDDYNWGNLETGAYCNYGNDPSNYAIYGRLFNWYAVETEKLCPKGWHVPTDTEWTPLTTFLGGENVAGGKLKETGTSHWQSPNTGATNSSGFTALPSGYRGCIGAFGHIGYYGYWWSSPEAPEDYGNNDACHLVMTYNFSNARIFSTIKTSGFSVRCLRDF